ncbi:alpha/beta fold hydrolase [Alteromonas flava]|uniref:alpha/beta fold hydrolase n=1 Tax=Alteromonas flava TaxID=2048003 RepID=UPI000C28B799|nr:alpha/beta hydrolase [Alteromonas flava]
MQTISEPALFLPGTLCDERIWLPVWRHMSFATGARQYVPLQWANDLQQMLALTHDRLNANSKKVHLIGFSMGGYIASLAALESNNVASLTLMGYSPQGLSAQETSARKHTISAIEKRQFTGMTQAHLSQYLTAVELGDEQICNTILSMATDLGINTLKHHFSATTPRQDLRSKLQSLKVPIYCIAAEHDQIASAQSVEDFCQHKSSVECHVIESTAHMMSLTQPQRCAQLITANIARSLQSAVNLG